MAGQWVDDPSWGQALSGVFGGGQSHTADILLKAEQIKAAREKAREQALIEQARVKAIEAQNQTYTDVNMPPPDVNVPVADFNLGTFDAEGNPTSPATLGSNTSFTLRSPDRSYGLNEPFYNERERVRATDELGTRLATSREDLLKDRAKNAALTQVDLYGVPQDRPSADRLQTMLTGSQPQYSTEKQQPTLHNVDIVGPDGKTVTQRIMTSSGIDVQTGKQLTSILPPGYTIGLGTPRPPTKGPVANEEEIQGTILGAIDEFGKTKSLANPTAVERAISVAYKQQPKFAKDAHGNDIELIDGTYLPADIQPVVGYLNELRKVKATERGAAGAAPGSIASAAPQQIVQPGGFPPGAVTRAPASEVQQKNAERVVLAHDARESIEQMIGVDRATGQLPQKFYIPSAASTALFKVSQTNGVGSELYKSQYPKDAEYYQLARNWVEQVIRQASGMAIGAGEYVNYYAQFIPEGNDTPAMVARKINVMRQWEDVATKATTVSGALDMLEQVARQNGSRPAVQAAQQMRVRAREAGTIDQPIAPDSGARPAPKVGDVVNGFTFKGGDPNSREAWQ